MHKVLKHTVFVFVFLCFAFPAIQQFFHVFKEIPLEGAYNVPNDSTLNWANWTSGAFQQTFSEATNYRIGFRTDFVRTRNQIDYSFFDQTHVVDVVKGKNNYLFRYSAYFVNGGPRRAEDSIRNDILRLRRWQDSLKAKGKFLLYVIAPEKMYYYKEYLPYDTILTPRSNRHYLLYRKYLQQYQCDYIDLNSWFVQNKAKTSHTIFSKGGYHWTQYAAYLGYDSIVNYLRQKTVFSIPRLEVQKVKHEKTPWAPDVDVFKSCNLFVGLNESKFTYVEVKTDTTRRTTTAVVSADSFFHAIAWPGFFQKTFSPQSTFWYYNREINSPDSKIVQNIEEININDHLDEAQVYIVMYTVLNLEKFDYGFLKILDNKK